MVFYKDFVLHAVNVTQGYGVAYFFFFFKVFLFFSSLLATYNNISFR